MALDDVPAGQLVQVEAPGESLYVPCIASEGTLNVLQITLSARSGKSWWLFVICYLSVWQRTQQSMARRVRQDSRDLHSALCAPHTRWDHTAYLTAGCTGGARGRPCVTG